MRRLSPDEAELWSRVTATIKPLSREKAEPEAPVDRAPPPARLRAPQRVAPPARRPAPLRPAGGLDGSWDRRLGTGDVRPDRTVDLHGMSLDGAWRAIDRALEQAIQREERIVLLITGHHRPGDPPVQRGKIRAAVHDWLAASRHAPRIAAVRGAHRRHGGGGSLYLVLRRR